MEEDADDVLLHAQRVVVVAAVTRDPALACFVVEVPVAATASWLAAQVVVACFSLGVAEGIVVPDVLLGAAALGGAAAHAACFGHAREDFELVAHVLATAAGGDLGEIRDVGGAELPRSRFVVFVAEDHGCGGYCGGGIVPST